LIKDIIKITTTFNGCITLTPFKSSKYKYSTTNINHQLQHTLNLTEESISIGAIKIKTNDPVLVNCNNYYLNLFNGMTGKVTEIGFDNNLQEQYCLVQFDGMEVQTKLTKSECYDVMLSLAYAITVHKSQGSEYDVCIIIIEGDMIERSMLYTAVTRAKKLCIIMSSLNNFNLAITRPPRVEKIQHGFSLNYKISQ